MEALIMAAGKGSRLGDLTDNLPKSLLKLNEEDTLLSYNLKNLAKLNISQVLLVTGFEHEQCERHAMQICKDLELNLKIIYNPFWDHCNVLGSMYLSLDHLSQDFIFLHADTILQYEAIKLLSEENSEAILTVDRKKCGEEEMKVKLDRGFIQEITKTMNPQEAFGEFVGVAKFSKSVISYFKQTSIDLFSKGDLNLYMEAVLQHALEKGDMKIDFIDTSEFKSIEIDFVEDLEKARKIFKTL